MTPAGKAMRKLQLLSGGEKSLVALAFVFSVFMARPSPFYILDEVEAALDDANIDRFLQLVRRFSEPRPVHRRHPSEAHDGRGRRPLRRLDGAGWHHQGRLAADAGRRGRDPRRRRLAIPAFASPFGGALHILAPMATGWSDVFILPDGGQAAPAAGARNR